MRLTMADKRVLIKSFAPRYRRKRKKVQPSAYPTQLFAGATQPADTGRVAEYAPWGKSLVPCSSSSAPCFRGLRHRTLTMLPKRSPS